MNAAAPSKAHRRTNRAARVKGGPLFRSRRLHHLGPGVALGLCLSLGTAGVSHATPTGDSGALACPVQAARFQQSGSIRVFLVGPDKVAYAVANETVYHQLWRTFDGITQWPGDTVSSCFGGSHVWSDAFLIRDPNGFDPRKVYVYDGRIQRYRWITSEAVFNKYKFDPARIRLGPVSPVEVSNDNWDN